MNQINWQLKTYLLLAGPVPSTSPHHQSGIWLTMLQQAHMVNRASKLPNFQVKMLLRWYSILFNQLISGESWEMIRPCRSEFGFRATIYSVLRPQGHKDVANWTRPWPVGQYLFIRPEVKFQCSMSSSARPTLPKLSSSNGNQFETSTL